MPAKAPPSGPQLKKILRDLGHQIRQRRKDMSVSAVATTEAAGVSRMTLNRIERGESSVTIGAYLNVISALGLKFEISDITQKKSLSAEQFDLPEKIRLADYPQLKRLAWQLKGTKELSPEEACNLYERNWRHLDLKKIETEEWAMMQKLLVLLGRGRPLV